MSGKRFMLGLWTVLVGTMCVSYPEAQSVLMPPEYCASDLNGRPLSGGTLESFAAGTTTPMPLYTDFELTVPHPNPVVLDARGCVAAYMLPTSYRFILRDAAGNQILDRVVSSPALHTVSIDIEAQAGETVAAGQLVYLADGSDGTTASRWYLTDADTASKSIGARIVGVTLGPISAGFTGTVRVQGRVSAFSGLTPGASYYVSSSAGTLAATPPSNRRFVGIAASNTDLVLANGTYEPAAPVFAAGTFLANPFIQNNEPGIQLRELDASPNQGGWLLSANAAVLRLAPVDDGGGVGSNLFQIARNGNATLAGTLTVSAANASGTITAAAFSGSFSGSGAGLTNIPETAITDGSIFPRLAANETITGRWIFNGQPQQFIADEATTLAITLRGRPSDNVAAFNMTNNANSVAHLHVAASPSAVTFATNGQSYHFVNGYIATNPSQPGFLAYNWASDISVPTGTTVDFDAELYDTTNNFASDVFTAPASGIYQFCTTVNVAPDAGNSFIDLVTSVGTFRLGVSVVSGVQNGCVHVNLSASQTAFVRVNNQTGGTQTIQGGSNPILTWFSGRLLP